MKNNFTLLKVLDQLALSQGNDTKKRMITENTQAPKKETIRNIIAYAKSVKCYKTKSIDKVLFVLN
ncbi:MAG: hypothetical protein H8E84_01395 [Flavobacteriales bacterium]|nr:hypothetical protein [Flavobacteriales bacterium]